MRKKLIVFTIITLIFTLPLAAFAATSTPQVVIAEVNWAGSSTSNADEWLELQNLEGKTIDLSGWSIEGAGASGAAIALPAGASIGAGGIYLVSNYNAAHSTLAVEPNFITTSVSLSNSALKLILKNATGLTVDTVGDGKVPVAGSSKAPFASMERFGNAWSTASTNKNFDLRVGQLGTPGLANVTIVEPEIEAVPIQIIEPVKEVFATTAEPIPTVKTASPATNPSVTSDLFSPPLDIPSDPLPTTSTIAEVVAEAIMETPLTNDVANAVSASTKLEAATASIVVEPTANEAVESITNEQVTTTNDLAPIMNVVQQSEAASVVTTYAEGDIIINEVVSNPVSGNEWVEIYNPYDNVISLDGWKLTEAGGTSVALSGLIGEEAFVVAEFKSKLNNSGDTVMLSDPSGVIIDDVSFGDSGEADAPSKGTSLARTNDEEFVITTTPTRNETNHINEPEVVKEQTKKTTEIPKVNTSTITEVASTCSTESTLVIIKLLPNPIGDEETDELIVIENTSDETLCLDGWTVGDASKTYKLAGALGGHLRLELPRPATKIALNNTSSEEVLLTNPAGEIINKITYENAEENSIYTLLDGQWSWQTIPSGNEPTNVQCPDAASGDDEVTETDHASTNSVGTAKTTKKASEQKTVEGTVVATPGTFGEQIMYIDGLQLFQYSGDFPALEVGDVVSVSGVPSTSHGEARLKLASSDKLRVVGNDIAEPTPIELSDSTDHIGNLVSVEGTVTRRSGDRLTLESEGEALTVIAKDGTDISFTGLVLGTELEVTGVISTYDGASRLLPRSTDDVEEIDQQTNETTEDSTPTPHPPLAGIGLVGATTTAVGARAWWWKRKKNLI